MVVNDKISLYRLSTSSWNSDIYVKVLIWVLGVSSSNESTLEKGGVWNSFIYEQSLYGHRRTGSIEF